jgi:hypothetical protein
VDDVVDVADDVVDVEVDVDFEDDVVVDDVSPPAPPEPPSSPQAIRAMGADTRSQLAARRARLSERNESEGMRWVLQVPGAKKRRF